MKKACKKLLLFSIFFVPFFMVVNHLFSCKNKIHFKTLTQVRIIDAKNPRPIEDGTILIEGNIIKAVGRRDEIELPEGTEVIDLKGKTVMPGFDRRSCPGRNN